MFIEPAPERKPDLIDAIAAICEKSGSTREVGPAYYKAFTQLTDAEMAEAAFDLIRHQRGYLERKEGDVIANASDFVTNMFSLVASGNIGFDEYGRVTFFEPVGPEPTIEMWEQIDARIDRAAPLITSVARKVFPPPH